MKSPFSDPRIKEKAKKTFKEHYGVDHPWKDPDVRKQIKQTMMEKYGVDNPFKSKEIQEKIKEKFKKTIEERKKKQWEELPFEVPDFDKIRGTRTASEGGIRKHYPKFYKYIIDNFPDVSFKEKIWMYLHNTHEKPICLVCGNPVRFDLNKLDYAKYCSSACCNSDPNKMEKTYQNNLQKYGVKNISQLQEVRDKVKQTNLERYGVECVMKSPIIKAKIQQSLNKRTQEEKQKIKDKQKNTMMERYGMEYSILLPNVRTNNAVHSKPNDMFAKLLEKNKIQYVREFPIGKFLYDFKIGNLLIEINPSITHNINFNPFNNKPIDENYHFNKSLTAKNNGYKCIHVWDWDDIDKVIHLLQKRKTIRANKCNIQEISQKDANQFLENNHLQGKCRGNKVSIGLFFEEELIGVMTYGKPRYNKNYEWELLRLCFKNELNVTGGTQKMFKYFIENYKPISILSYCDTSKFSGDIYEKLGFQFIQSKPSRHWFHLKTKQHITDNMLRLKGFDNIFETNFGKGTSNDELMRQHNFIEIYDSGQTTYGWHK